jgi:hypothetical protein
MHANAESSDHCARGYLKFSRVEYFNARGKQITINFRRVDKRAA